MPYDLPLLLQLRKRPIWKFTITINLQPRKEIGDCPPVRSVEKRDLVRVGLTILSASMTYELTRRQASALNIGSELTDANVG